MNRQLVGGGFVFAGGLLLGFLGGVVLTKDKLEKEYLESTESFKRAIMKMRDDINVDEIHVDKSETPIKSTTHHEIVESIHVTEQESYAPAENNPYHVAIAATQTPDHVFLSGEPNEYGIGYIEEDEFLEEDGRMKNSIQLVMDAHNPTFFMDGEKIDDWAERLGPSIVKDFLEFMAPVPNPVLYVRNYRTEEDYEVTPERP